MNAAAATAEAAALRRADIETAVATGKITRIERTHKRASNDRDNCTCNTPIETRDGDGLLTEAACFSRAEDWGKTEEASASTCVRLRPRYHQS